MRLSALPKGAGLPCGHRSRPVVVTHARRDRNQDSVVERLSGLAGKLDADEELQSGISSNPQTEEVAVGRVTETGLDTQRDSAGLFSSPEETPDDCLPKVAVLGRPNVGKSALFNRFSRTSTAIVFDTPGITRDRLYVRAFWGNTEFMLIDTGGLAEDNQVTGLVPKGQSEDAEEIPLGVEIQVALAVEEADAAILVVDGMEGLTVNDQEIVSWLRSQHATTPVVLAVNKCENFRVADQMAAEFWELGIEPFPVSAISGLGTGDLLDALVSQLPPPRPSTSVSEADLATSVAILGRPNTGKSSLLNVLVREERAIVSSVPGTTRDAVDAEFFLKDGRKVKVVDTAGVRRRMAVYGSKEKVETMMVGHSIRAIRQANVAILMVDADEGVTKQDFKLSDLAAEEGCALVVVANKYDLITDEKRTPQIVEMDVRLDLREVNWAEVVVTSLKDQNPVKKITRAILNADKNHQRRVPTATLNMVIRDAVNWRPPPYGKHGRKGMIYYATQPSVRPPTFVLFVNDPKIFTDGYKRHLKRQLRENIGFDGTPIRLIFRGKPARALGDFRGKR